MIPHAIIIVTFLFGHVGPSRIQVIEAVSDTAACVAYADSRSDQTHVGVCASIGEAAAAVAQCKVQSDLELPSVPGLPAPEAPQTVYGVTNYTCVN